MNQESSSVQVQRPFAVCLDLASVDISPEADLLQGRVGMGTTDQVHGEHLVILPVEAPAWPGPRDSTELFHPSGIWWDFDR